MSVNCPFFTGVPGRATHRTSVAEICKSSELLMRCILQQNSYEARVKVAPESATTCHMG